MKQLKNVLIAILVCALFIAPFGVAANPALPYVQRSTQMRGLWVTSAYNLDWPSSQGLTPAQLRAEIDDILNRAANQGINAVFVQVRPKGDALYPSEIFPWSHLISGTQGTPPAGGFDPLEYWVQQAHALGIEVHAWLNPFRATFPNQDITNPALLYANHPARLNPGLVIAYGRSLFFDPGNPAARQLIVDGAAELMRNYNLDGIHLDDYFYPSRNFPDQATFARYGGGVGLHEWRRENINALIRDLQRVTHEGGGTFGVSPFAIWMNESNNPLGSNTQGGIESYYNQYADTRRWVLEGWVDYIVPQIYWIEGNPAACFEIVLSWWEDLVRGTDVRLYVGMAPYREVQNRPGWDGQIIRQMERIANSPVAQGSIFFRERYMRNRVGDAIGQFYYRNLPGQVPTRAANVQPQQPPTPPQPPKEHIPIAIDRLSVAQPSGANFTIRDAAGFWFHGAGVPGVPVYVNGTLITDRTAEGFFSIFLPLVRGENVFTFTQAGQATVTRNINNTAPPAPPAPQTMSVGVINAFPAADEFARVGTEITLRATAPAGATVTAEVGGQVVNMTQTNADLRSTATNILAAQFTGTFTLNAQAADDAIVDLGRPIYTMTWNNQTRSATAAGHIRQLGPQAPMFAEITADSAWAFPGATTTGGSNQMLLRGQIDRVAAISGDWTRLASGGWVQNDNVRRWNDATLVPPPVVIPGAAGLAVPPPILPANQLNLGFLSEGRYISGRYWDTIKWMSPFFPAVLTEFDGNELIVSLGMQSVAPPIFYTPGGTLFSNIRIGTHNGAPAYFMTLRPGARLEGFYATYADGHLQLILRHRRPLTPGDRPFTGFTFVVDPGHGRVDPGALGPMGGDLPEAAIVMGQAVLLAAELEALGAYVVLTHRYAFSSGTTRFEVWDRVPVSRNVNPDMFISLHTNSTAESTNASNIRGFTVWFRNENSRPAAQAFLDVMHDVNPYTNRNRSVNQANFYVCRPMWSPHILLEASFTNNIHDFSWMINPRNQEEYVRQIVNALLAYYR